MAKIEWCCTWESITRRASPSWHCHQDPMTMDCGYSHCTPSSGSQQQEHGMRGGGGLSLNQEWMSQRYRGSLGVILKLGVISSPGVKAEPVVTQGFRVPSLPPSVMWNRGEDTTQPVRVPEALFGVWQRTVLSFSSVWAVGEYRDLSKESFVSVVAKGGRNTSLVSIGDSCFFKVWSLNSRISSMVGTNIKDPLDQIKNNGYFKIYHWDAFRKESDILLIDKMWTQLLQILNNVFISYKYNLVVGSNNESCGVFRGKESIYACSFSCFLWVLFSLWPGIIISWASGLSILVPDLHLCAGEEVEDHFV